MPSPNTAKLIAPALVVITILLASCGLGEPAATPTPTLPSATPTPTGPQTLNICMAEEPSSLYLYADNSAAARAVRQAIYDGPFDLTGYEPQAVILESVPSLENGGALLQAVPVNAGALVIDVDGLRRPLQPGVRVRPAGCKDGNCVVEYTGGEIQMDQLVVTFTLKAGLTWSDGTPLTASDSVYSYELQADAATTDDKSLIESTASYTATDDRTAVWTGLPGARDPGYRTNFWTPLPRHAWGATAAADLVVADMAARTPLGWGAYVIASWQPGEHISLTRNSAYFRAAEGLPKFAELNFIFADDPAAAVLSAECDLALPADANAAASALESAGAQLYYAPSGSWQHLDLGIRPLSYDNEFNVFQDRADYFGDVRMRQALTLCIDRASLQAQFGLGQGAAPDSYLPPEHPLSEAAAATYAFDTVAGSALLDELGWLVGADGLRANATYPGAMQGVPLAFNLHAAEDAGDLEVAQALQADLAECGIALNIQSAPADLAFAPGPDGAVFGRNFDLALFAWPFANPSGCYLYLSEAVPGSDFSVYKYGWGGWNISGFHNAEYDAACKTALISLPGEAGYGDAERRAQALFTQYLPAIPLYVPYQLAAARTDFCGFNAGTGDDLLQSLETYGYAEWCQ